MATFTGTVLGKNEPRVVTLKAPREGEPPTKMVNAIRILDETLSDVVTVESWGADPWPDAKQGDQITVTVRRIEYYAGKIRGSL